ncbi:RHS repeat-associated core domain-containing protein [Prosthecobacter sp.]|uniref:RHS repeat-associated core domain-containing protein n=1 Tax=Prosthecobacter sp. TaxID=1965333 RepID=UPI001D6DF287|nr:RHS repeat-associated core domain-containing protein [Prosthecobacter sp.]MCB1275380.1 RHS repeat protein [Prosthecobacter sp.]
MDFYEEWKRTLDQQLAAGQIPESYYLNELSILRNGQRTTLSELGLYASRMATSCVGTSTPGVKSGINAQTDAAASNRGSEGLSHAADPIDMATGGHLIRRAFFFGVLDDEPGLVLEHLSVRTAENLVGRSWAHDWQARASYDAPNDAVTIHWINTRANRFTRTTPTGPWRSADWDVRYDRVVSGTGGGWRLERQAGDAWEFDSAGRLTARVTRHGRRVTVSRDANQRVAALADSTTGRTLTFAYDGAGRLLTVRDPLNREVRLEYNADGDLELLTDPAGNATFYGYNSTGQVLTAVDQEGRILFTNTYDGSGRVTIQSDGVPGHPVTTINYDEEIYPGHIVTTLKDRLGNGYSFIHDDEYRLESRGEPGSRNMAFVNTAPPANENLLEYATDPRFAAIKRLLDPAGNVLSVTDSIGLRETSTYDEAGNRTSQQDSLNHTTTFSYNGNRSVTSITDPRGKITLFTYNAAQQPLTRTRPRGGVTTWSYSAGGVLQSITDEASQTTQFTYDAAGRLIGTTDPANGSTTWALDGMDRVTEMTDPLNRHWRWTYDSHGHVLTATDPASRVTTHTYDGNGNRLTTRDPVNGLTTYVYDAEDNLTMVTDPAGRVTEYQYDGAGRLTGTRLAPGLAWAMLYLNATGDVIRTDGVRSPMIADYDVRSRITSVGKELTTTTYFGYEGHDCDRLAAVSIPWAGRETSFAYDNAGNLTQVTKTGGGQSTLTYDDDGNLASVTDANGQTTAYSYDAAGRMTSETMPGGGSIQYGYNNRDLLTSRTNARNQQATMTYDAAGRMTAQSDPAGTVAVTYDNVDNVTAITEGSKTLGFEYDALDRVTRFTDAEGNVIEYGYDGAGLLTSLTYPGGRVVTYGYDAAGRLTSVTDWAGRVTTYTWDSLSRLSSETKPNGVITSRNYASTGVVTQIRVWKGAATIAQIDMQYSLMDRITSETREGITDFFPPSVKMTIGADNRLATFDGQSCAHDADGNMTSGPDRTGAITPFSYDARNRLSAHGGIAYSYDALNHRVAYATTAGTTRFVVDPVSELSQVLIRTDPSGNQTFYVYGLGLIAEDGPSGYRVYHYDRRGSTIALTDAAGQVAQRFAYGPYGEYSGDPATALTPFLFNGRDGVMTDPNGLYCMRSRFYHPLVKRFVNRDVWSGDPTEPLTLNRYAFVTGDPISLTDPYGLSPLDSDAVTVQPFSDVGGAQPQGPVFGPPSPPVPSALDRKLEQIHQIMTDVDLDFSRIMKARIKQARDSVSDAERRANSQALQMQINKIRRRVDSPVSDKGKFLIRPSRNVGGVRD